MIPGKESKTAIMVCLGRASAHRHSPTPRFADPTAEVLLPEDARLHVRNLNEAPTSAREGFRQRMAQIMVPRTVAIDEAVAACEAPQVVILGAGLDGRAWRMDALHQAVVFEVDHPDSQQAKRARLGQLVQKAREVRFVPVDFTRDDLATALTQAGHDPAQRTMWIWEGVVMYLTKPQIRSTLAVVQQRSAQGSRIAILYHRPALFLWFFRWVLRAMGEPLRSSHKPPAMRALLGEFDFRVMTDENLAEITQRLGLPPEWSKGASHPHVVVAEKT